MLIYSEIKIYLFLIVFAVRLCGFVCLRMLPAVRMEKEAQVRNKFINMREI